MLETITSHSELFSLLNLAEQISKDWEIIKTCSLVMLCWWNGIPGRKLQRSKSNWRGSAALNYNEEWFLLKLPGPVHILIIIQLQKWVKVEDSTCTLNAVRKYNTAQKNLSRMQTKLKHSPKVKVHHCKSLRKSEWPVFTTFLHSPCRHNWPTSCSL